METGLKFKKEIATVSTEANTIVTKSQEKTITSHSSLTNLLCTPWKR